MIGLNPIGAAQRQTRGHWLTRQLTHQSSARENVFEHLLLAQIGAELLARCVEYDELRSSVDKDGYDVLLEAGDIQRHTQLKVMIRGGKRSDVNIHRRLATRPSGCVIWLTYDPATRSFCDIRWFGAAPGQPLPDLGDKVARHSRANAQGIKGERPDHRIIAARRFERLDDVAHLVDRLFGRLPADPLAFLYSRLQRDVPAEPAWLQGVAEGDFTGIPTGIGWDDGIALAGMIDGYRLLELTGGGEPAAFLDRQRTLQQATGRWTGDAVELWTTAFLEARADRFGSNDEGRTPPRLDLLIQQLRGALIALETAHA
jgi:hypothetical protein